jgi:regulator of RNase E activity RraA
VPLHIPAENSTTWPDTVVKPGDIMVCDIDGCVVIPSDYAGQVAAIAEKGKEVDERIAKALREGMGVAEAMKKYRS